MLFMPQREANMNEKYTNVQKEHANMQGKYTKLTIYFVIIVIHFNSNYNKWQAFFK